MNKPKIGDKYIIEIDSHMTNENGDLYGIKGFNSLVFDQNGLDKLTRMDLEEDGFVLHVGDEVEDQDGRTAYVLMPRNKGGRHPLLLMSGYAFPQWAYRKKWRKIGHSETLELFVKEAYAALVGENEEDEQ